MFDNKTGIGTSVSDPIAIRSDSYRIQIYPDRLSGFGNNLPVAYRYFSSPPFMEVAGLASIREYIFVSRLFPGYIYGKRFDRPHVSRLARLHFDSAVEQFADRFL